LKVPLGDTRYTLLQIPALPKFRLNDDFTILERPLTTFRVDDVKIVDDISDPGLEFRDISNSLYLRRPEMADRRYDSVYRITVHEPPDEGESADDNIQQDEDALLQLENDPEWIKITYREIENSLYPSESPHVAATVGGVEVWFYSSQDGRLRLKSAHTVSDPHMNGFELVNLQLSTAVH
jgi:hypothetical protein